jgi:LacI family transcriptional regulator
MALDSSDIPVETPLGVPGHGRSRVTDIARLADVSTATVDRVLNLRKGVRPATVQRVLKAAAQLGYLAEEQLFKVIRPKPMRLSFLLPAGNNRFIAMLGDYIEIAEQQFAAFNVQCKRHVVEGFDPKILAENLLYYGRRAQGIAFIALEHPLVREAVNTLVDEGIPVLTLVSDLSNSKRAAYVGVDNRAAGRTAGFLLGRFLGHQRGKIAMIAGSLSYRGHEERELGFMHLFQEMFPNLQVLGLREGQDDSNKNYQQTRALLAQHADLIGIYNIGGSSDGVARAIGEARLAHRVVFVGHELTPDTRALLIDGTMDAVISQNAQIEVMNCVRIFTNLREQKAPLAGIEAVRVGVVVRENLP